jgi:hypothetical protein
MKFDINGTFYEFDLNHVPVRDAMRLKVATGMNWKPFLQSIDDYDPDCLLAVAWVVLTRAGVINAAGVPLKLADVPDFDLSTFLVGEQDVEEPDGEADPPTAPSSPSGITPDSTSPEPSTITD